MTNREIAQRLQISPAALSLVINHKPGVSDETRARVITELKKLGYDHLVKKEPVVPSQTNNLCFVVFKRHGQILDLQPFFLLLMEHIEKRCRSYGYNMLMATIDLRYPLEQQMNYLKSLDIKGAVIFATEMAEEDVGLLKQIDVPYIVVDNAFSYLPINTVAINNQMGTFQAISHLVETGHETIGYIKGSARISSFVERDMGYHDALKHFGLSIDPLHEFTVRYSEEGSYQDFLQILKTCESLPTAFVTDDDTIAAGAIRALTGMGYRVPEDISVIGYNDRPLCTITNPALTTISVSKYSFAVDTIDALINIMKIREETSDELRTKKIRIETKLLERESVKRIVQS